MGSTTYSSGENLQWFIRTIGRSGGIRTHDPQSPRLREAVSRAVARLSQLAATCVLPSGRDKADPFGFENDGVGHHAVPHIP
jgi:hypothetical protein